MGNYARIMKNAGTKTLVVIMKKNIKIRNLKFIQL